MMALRELGPEGHNALEQVLGYLNFSSGAPDPQLLANLNLLYGLVPQPDRGAGWQIVHRWLCEKLERLQEEASAFAEAEQARGALGLVWEHVLPGYLHFHRDLLFHQTPAALFGPFFVGRACEAVLQQGPPWDNVDRLAGGSISRLNDYIGHRPVAVLEGQKIEPYGHEWVRPVPLYVSGAGVAVGRYHDVVQLALELLESTDADILQSACFDPQRLDELAFDPRAYDFDHPVNKRPNYHFGQWDPHHIDNQGRYRRFVVQQVTLDALMARLDQGGELPADELLLEGAAVLAGTILMASGVSGSGPDTHDSTVTLANLLPRVAGYRDLFYERLLGRIEGSHGERLEQEASELRQPLGAARQHLNAQLARRRASQLEHVHLAKLFARMGYSEEALRQANVVPVASARMLCQIDCRLTAGHRAIETGQLDQALALLPEIMDLLHRGIACGAVVDPWNILGFDAHFSLFPALENSIHDHRVDDLVELMEQILAYHSQLWSEAAARDQQDLCREIDRHFHDTATWWRQYAAHEVGSVEAIDPLDAYHAAQHVAEALNLWHKGGAATGDVAFWAPHAQMFDSSKAHALVIEALLQRNDFVASMSLLVHWLSQAQRMPLETSGGSFCQLAERWLLQLRHGCALSRSAQPDDSPQRWTLVRKFFDYLEANAEQYWEVPRFELGAAAATAEEQEELERLAGEPDEDEEDLFGAAYEGVVYRDSTDDGVQGELFDTESISADELAEQSEQISERLVFLTTLARMWQMAAVSPELAPEPAEQAERVTTMERWIEQAAVNQQGLLGLLDAVRAYRIATPGGDHDSMVQYDRQRLIKETLLERIIATSVETVDARRLLLAAAAAQRGLDDQRQAAVHPQVASLEEDERQMIAVLGHVLGGDPAAARDRLPGLMQVLGEKPLLYVPLAKGGNARDIVTTRVRQRSLQDLLAWLPRLGLLLETCRLIETAREMERHHPVGPGAVTEFDELFKIGYQALVESLVRSAQQWPEQEDPAADAALVSCLEQLTESLLISWLAHSRTLRLSVLEKVYHPPAWEKLVRFIQRYGSELFTQRFLNLGNVRAILHQGVDAWLGQLQERPHPDVQLQLLDDLDRGISRNEAVEQLTLVLEAIVENYGEYRDYNSTTTQSDRGELLYALLDFLRLRTRYDRICWNLKPVVLAHEILVRQGEPEAAGLWRRALIERISHEADQYLEELNRLQKQYAMRMPTIADRLAERFVQPLAIDRIRALVEPAIAEAAGPEPRPHFELLRDSTERLAREPTGVGLDVPVWLGELEEEVEEARRPPHERSGAADLESVVPPRPLLLEEVQRQLDVWTGEE